MTTTVLILGAAGRLGQGLTEAFSHAGWTVRAQARKPLPASLAVLSGVQPVHCDATEVAAVRAAAKGVQVVIHALSPPYTRWACLALPLMDVAIEAAISSGALLMFPGNVYNFGRELPPLLAPHTPESGDTPKAKLRIESEARLAAAPGLDSVVIRAGDFFGGLGRGSWFDLAVASKVAQGRVTWPGPVDLAHAWAYVPDLARAFVEVAARRALLQGHHRLHFKGHTLTGTEMCRAIGVATARPQRLVSLPWTLMRLGSLIVPMLREMVTMRYLWDRPHQLEDSALQALIGSVPHTPLHQAMSESLQALGHLPPAQSTAASFKASARA